MTEQQEFLDRIAGIADVIRGEAEQAEIDRRLGDKTVEALRDTGLLRMLLPAHYGGGESFAIGEALSRVNGSAGWNLQIGATTASNDAMLDAMFAADRFLCAPGATGLAPDDPAAALPLFSRFGGGVSWVSIGIARGALDALGAVAATKVPVAGSGPLAERLDVQIDVARAHGLIEAGAAFLRQAWASAETKLASGHRLDVADQAMLRLSSVTSAEYAASATDIVVRTADSAGLYERDGIARCWRDANAVTKHVTVSARFYERVGRILLGLAPLPGPV